MRNRYKSADAVRIWKPNQFSAMTLRSQFGSFLVQELGKREIVCIWWRGTSRGNQATALNASGSSVWNDLFPDFSWLLPSIQRFPKFETGDDIDLKALSVFNRWSGPALGLRGDDCWQTFLCQWSTSHEGNDGGGICRKILTLFLARCSRCFRKRLIVLTKSVISIICMSVGRWWVTGIGLAIRLSCLSYFLRIRKGYSLPILWTGRGRR